MQSAGEQPLTSFTIKKIWGWLLNEQGALFSSHWSPCIMWGAWLHLPIFEVSATGRPLLL